MLGIVPYSGTGWMVKQYLLQIYTEYKSKNSNSPRGSSSSSSSSSSNGNAQEGSDVMSLSFTPSLVESLVMNAIAGLCGQFVTYVNMCICRG